MKVEVLRPFLTSQHKMTKKGDVINVPIPYGHYLIGNGVAREFKESEKVEFKTKPENFELSWKELQKKAKDQGIYKVGMTKEEVIQALK